MSLINLNRKLKPQGSVGLKRLEKRKRGRGVKIAVFLVTLLVIFSIPGRGIYLAAKDAARGGREITWGAKQNDLALIKSGVIITKNAVGSLSGYLNWFFWLGYVPFIGGYYNDAQHFAQAVSYELKVAEDMVEILEPYKQELGLVGQPVPGQDKVSQGVKILEKVLPSIDNVEPEMKKARAEVEGINVEKYPNTWRSIKVKSRVKQVKDFIIGAHLAVDENKEALALLPGALGVSSPKTYLLLFQNDKEIRPTGGFITAYAFLKFDKGHLSTTASDDIYRLDEKLLIKCRSKICPLAPPAPIVKYLPEVTGKLRSAWSMRDSNLSPDLPTSAKEFERMYEMLGEGITFDGIITIDTQVVEELIAITGPIDVYGTKYSAETDQRCNCPNVIYELEHYAEVAAKGELDRKAILGTLMEQILIKVLGSFSDKLPEFIDVGVNLANSKHIMFSMHDQNLQTALGKLNWIGEIRNFEGDYIHLNDSNFAGGKSNLYVEEKVTYEIKVDNQGDVTNKVTVEYKNPQPFNTWLNGILRDYVRLYVPKGAKLVSSKGSDDPVTSVEDEKLNKTYFEAFITVRPQNSRTLSFEYTLPNKVQGKTYPLLIQKQSGAKDHHYVIKINGSKKAEFDLTSDKELILNL